MKRLQINLSFKSSGKDKELYDWLKDMYEPNAFIKQQLWFIYIQQHYPIAAPQILYPTVSSQEEPIVVEDKLAKSKKRNIVGL